MLLWTLDELKMLPRDHPMFQAKHKDNIEEEVAEEFRRYGGKARLFFLSGGVEKEFESELDKAIAELLGDGTKTAKYIAERGFYKGMDRVFYRVMDGSVSILETSGCTFWHPNMDADTKLIFGSGHSKKKFMQTFLEMQNAPQGFSQ